MADLAALDADLAETGRAEIMRVDGHRRRALGAAVGLEGPDAELLLECGGQPLGQFFRATATTRRLPNCSGAQPRM